MVKTDMSTLMSLWCSSRREPIVSCDFSGCSHLHYCFFEATKVPARGLFVMIGFRKLTSSCLSLLFGGSRLDVVREMPYYTAGKS